MRACIGEPISWLRLEAYALDYRDPAVAEHVVACAACRDCLDEITRDVVALPPLGVPATGSKSPPRHLGPERGRRTWWLVFVPALAAAALLVFVLRPRPGPETFAVKGIGKVTIGVVRERAGAITFDAREFRTGDRWKVIVTCPPAAGAFIDVSVGPDVDPPGLAPGRGVDRPLAPAHVACGNRVVVPGAFTLTGGANRVCVHVAASDGGDGDEGCVTIRPE